MKTLISIKKTKQGYLAKVGNKEGSAFAYGKTKEEAFSNLTKQCWGGWTSAFKDLKGITNLVQKYFE